MALMTVIFTVISPVFNFLSLQASFGNILFTIVAGAVLTAALVGLGAYGSPKVANFSVAFLAVQCLLNAILDLKNVFFISAPGVGSDIQTDAANMAAATGIPGILWVVIWIGLSMLMISLGLRFYAVKQNRKASDSVFDTPAA